jgi:hypothetical protein
MAIFGWSTMKEAARYTHLQQFMLMFRCKPLILLVWISSVLKM